ISPNVTSIRSFSVAERKKNLGGGFWIKAVTGYSLLADVFLFFFPTAVGIVLKNFKISFSVLDFGQRGWGECPKSKTPYWLGSIINFFRLNIFCKTISTIRATGREIAAFSGVTLSAIKMIITLIKDKSRLQNTAR